MYRYDEFDHAFVRDRVARFRDQVQRRIDGRLSEEEFRPLRLQNGLYLQLHAYMLRIAIPYGTMSSRQMRQLALIADKWDKGYGHFTTRQNIQFNWPVLKDTPEILDALADVEMHAIQTSGNCIRNVTADHFAGAAADEIEDPRPIAEVIRHWSTGHPEFSFLPRKFKIAITGAEHDRAAIKAHDIGLRLKRDAHGRVGVEVVVGGGLGRSPFVGVVLRDFVPKEELLAYLEAILRVYNLYGRRDNKYKARIKILVHEEGIEEIRKRVEAEFAAMEGPSLTPDPDELERIERYFAPPSFEELPNLSPELDEAKAADAALKAWVETNTHAHKAPGYAIVTVTLKKPGEAPGDATSDQMRALADLAETYGAGELRVSHEQNIVIPHVKKGDLAKLHAALVAHELATPNLGLASDIIACPGLDYCGLATARSIPVAQDIANRFKDHDAARAIGELKIKISGCINACGHHHLGHIGILGLEKAGKENYQITLGGDATENAALGQRIGPGLDYEDVGPAVERIVEAYLAHRASPDESFVDAVRRLGVEPFKTAVYEEKDRDAA
ncbi:MAG: nitrite/sulfite reductase [Neomegalonema sp.]|nr:nitrite/sulfite reductase [Neomegalonema sp.]